MLSEKELENLAELSRVRLTKTEGKRLRDDLEKILAYVAELKEVSTDGIPPMAGGTLLTNAARADEENGRLGNEGARKAFPENKSGFLKVPPVFGE